MEAQIPGVVAAYYLNRKDFSYPLRSINVTNRSFFRIEQSKIIGVHEIHKGLPKGDEYTLEEEKGP